MGWLVRHPLHAGVIVGLIVAVAFGLFAFPQEDSIDKTIDDWLPENATAEQAEIDSLIAALEEAQAGNRSLERVSEEEFRELDLDRSYAVPDGRQDGSFEIHYLGQTDNQGTVYVAERQVHVAPWWHPDRLLYRAASYHVDRFGEGLRLTYDRDWDRLGGLLIMDLIVGVIYGGIVAMILALFGTRELDVPGGSKENKIPPESPLDIFRPNRIPRVFGEAAPSDTPSRFP
jgi:hypothetical protein